MAPEAEGQALDLPLANGDRAESVSAWGNDALRLKADHDRRLRALDDFLAAYEDAHREITEEESVMPAAAPDSVRVMIELVE